MLSLFTLNRHTSRCNEDFEKMYMGRAGTVDDSLYHTGNYCDKKNLTGWNHDKISQAK